MNSERDKLERDRLVEKLGEIATGGRRTKTARLREIFDYVEAAKSGGAGNKEIVAGLAEVGLIFDVNNFKNAVSRIRKERTIEALTRANTTATQPAPSTPTTIPRKPSSSIATAKPKYEVKKKNAVKPVTKSSGKRKSILSQDKGMFADLTPPPADGMVDLKQR